jgi:hypothetical protein
VVPPGPAEELPADLFDGQADAGRHFDVEGHQLVEAFLGERLVLVTLGELPLFSAERHHPPAGLRTKPRLFGAGHR